MSKFIRRLLCSALLAGLVAGSASAAEIAYFYKDSVYNKQKDPFVTEYYDATKLYLNGDGFISFNPLKHRDDLDVGEASRHFVREYDSNGKLTYVKELSEINESGLLFRTEGAKISTRAVSFLVGAKYNFICSFVRRFDTGLPTVKIYKFDKDWGYLNSCVLNGNPFSFSDSYRINLLAMSEVSDSLMLRVTTDEISYRGFYDCLFIDIESMTDVTNSTNSDGELVYGSVLQAVRSATYASAVTWTQNAGGSLFYAHTTGKDFDTYIYNSGVNFDTYSNYSHRFNANKGIYESARFSEEILAERYDGEYAWRIPDSYSTPSQYYKAKYGIDVNSFKFTDELKLTVGSPYMYMGGSRLEVDPGRDTVPLVVNNRTLVPARNVVEVLGGTVKYNDTPWGDYKTGVEYPHFTSTFYLDGKTVTLTDGNADDISKSDTLYVSVTIPVESSFSEVLPGFEKYRITDDILVGGHTHRAEYKLDVMPQVINGRTYMPLRFISEALGLAVDYSAETKGITLLHTRDIWLMNTDTAAVIVGW